MTARMEQVRDLLVDELRACGDFDESDHLGEFAVLLSVHRINPDGHLGWVHTLLSDPDMSSHVLLGLMDHKKMQMQAHVTHALAPDDET